MQQELYNKLKQPNPDMTLLYDDFVNGNYIVQCDLSRLKFPDENRGVLLQLKAGYQSATVFTCWVLIEQLRSAIMTFGSSAVSYKIHEGSL
jgi:hypothetical protein